MSLQSDIMTALASLGTDKVWPQAVPDDIELPFVVYRILNKTPETTLNDSSPDIRYIVAFESYAEDYNSALTLAGQVETAIGVSGLTYYKDSSPGEEYIQLIEGFMEPVFFGFWHT